jgi:hypothetical protein
MNDFSDLEKELEKLRPAQPSAILFERIEEDLANSRPSVSGAKLKRWRFTQWSRRIESESGKTVVKSRELFSNWWSLGFGLAAAAVLLLFALVNIERRQEHQQNIAQTPRVETRPAPAETERSTPRSRFVPAGGTNFVYNARDEGLHFAEGSERPLRRVRYNTQQTWRWRNPQTGASLRVSYPSEEIVLIPVSIQ